MSGDQDRSGAGRLLGHEDVDLFTILPATRVEGLQVWNHRSGKWVRLDAPRGRDHHQHRRLHAADHQRPAAVDDPSRRQARDGSHLAAARVSFPIAVYVWEDEILEVLPGWARPDIAPIKAITFHTRSTSKFYGEDYAVEAG